MGTLSKGLKPFQDYEKVTHYGGPGDAWKRVIDEYQVVDGVKYVRRTVVPLSYLEFLQITLIPESKDAEQAQ